MLDVKKLLAKILTKLNTPIVIRYVGTSIGKTAGSHVAITAPTVSGYTFVCWVATATSGWVASTYVANPTAASTDIWNTTTNGTGNGNVNAYALYMRA